MKTKQNLIVMLLIFFTLRTEARVHLQLGSFEWSAPLLNFRLSYSSRSLYPGWWGLGWCSDLEWELELTGQKPLLKQCGEPRADMAVITRDDGTYTAQDQTIRLIFNGYGRPIFIELQGGSSMSMEWDRNVLKTVNSDGQSWSVRWNALEKRVSAFTSKRSAITFVFERGQLQRLGPQRFTYDENSNMTSIQYNSRRVHIRYDSEKDRVMTVQVENGCSTRYGYTEILKNKKLVLQTKIARMCFDRPAVEKTVEATFEIQNDSLAKLKGIQEAYL